MTTKPIIRHAVASGRFPHWHQLKNVKTNQSEKDVPLILDLITELAVYEKEPDAVLATEESLLDTLGFKEGSTAYAKTLLIFDDEKPAGMAL